MLITTSDFKISCHIVVLLPTTGVLDPNSFRSLVEQRDMFAQAIMICAAIKDTKIAEVD